MLSLIFFVSFSLLVKEDHFKSFDFDMTVKIQDNIPRSFDTIFSTFSLIGSFETTLIILLAILFIKMVKPHRKDKQFSLKNSFIYFLRNGVLGSFIFMVFFIAHIVEIIGKSFLDHAGPPYMFFRNDIPFFFPTTYIPHQAGIEGSYPSGHSMRTVFLSILFLGIILQSKKISLFLKTLLSMGIIIFTAIMLISRVTLGEHWTTDVIAGSFLGLGFGLISLIFL